MIEGIHRKMQKNMIGSVGYGYIVFPYNVDRQSFIQTAYRQEKVSILPDQGSSMIHDCYITKSALREIIFPQENVQLGSGVIYVTNYFNNKPFIIGVVSKEDESNLFEECGINFTKVFNQNKVTFDANAERGEVVINVSNREDAASILLNCVGQSGTKVTINCNGDFFATIDGNVNINTNQSIALTSNNAEETVTSSVVVSNQDVTVNPNRRFNVGGGGEPVPLGDELTRQLNQTNLYLSTLVQQIAIALPATGAPTGGPAATSFMTAMQQVSPGDYGNINSETSFTD